MITVEILRWLIVIEHRSSVTLEKKVTTMKSVAITTVGTANTIHISLIARFQALGGDGGGDGDDDDGSE